MKQINPLTTHRQKDFPLVKIIFVIIPILLGFLPQVFSQTIMFDDFTYSGVNDPQLSTFNKWSIVSGTNGPPSGAQYSRDNVKFINDPNNPNNRIMTLSTTVNGTNKSTTHSRIETSGFEYFEGTYAARVYFSETPYQYKDANIQTFYTIVSHLLGNDGSRYSEIDFEYMAADKWGTSTDDQIMYMTSWNRYIPEPWQAWKNYFTSKRSWEGWHTCVFSATNGKDVKFWIDGQYFGSMSVTDNDGSSVYPRSNMQVAFANWIWNNVTGSSTANRTTTMQVDWTLYYKDQELSPLQVDNLVQNYRSSGLQRRNLLGQTYVTSGNQAPTVSITAPANNTSFTAPASITITANASDADGTVSNVQFYNGNILLGSDATAPYSFTWNNVAAGNYAITARATDNSGATTTSPIINITVSNPVVQSPYGGTAWAIPGTIEAENYDLGGQNVAFNELTATNEGGAYRNDAVDIEPTDGGGYNIGYINTGEWLEYTVNVSAGTYKIDARVAATAAGKTFRLELDGTTIANFTVPNTGDWQAWQTVSVNNVALSGGTKVLRMYATSTDFNLDKLIFTSAVTNQTPTVSITAPANNATFKAPASVTINASASDLDGTISKVEFFNGNVLLGSDATTPYSLTWNNVASGTYAITAKATDNNGATATSSVITIIVNANQAPSVTITSPTNNASFTAPATITINANAFDADGSVTNVQFFNGTTSIGSDATAPYSFTWNNVAAGTYTITARATDNNGLTTTSAAITITVNNPIVQSPFGGTAAVIPGTIEAENYDLGGQGIAFNDQSATNEGAAYRNDAVDIEPTNGGGYNIGYINEGEWLEYTVNVTAGTYKIDARVAAIAAGKTFRLELDGASIANFTVPNTGDWQVFQTVSANNVALTGGQKVLRVYATSTDFNLDRLVFTPVVNNQAPTISITSPANSSNFTAPANIGISANASDVDGSISSVQFFNGTIPLATVTTAPYTYTWNNVIAGTYTIRAVASDNNGATASASVNINVSNPSGQSPYGGSAWSIPGTIEAENYDLGGQGIAFNDVTTTNQGGAYRTDAVDVEPNANGFNIGYIVAGEWVEYTTNVTAGAFKIDASVAAIAAGNSFRVELDGATIATFSVPNSGSWSTFQTISVNNVALTAGQKVLRIYAITGDFNIDKLTFSTTVSNNQTPFGGTAAAIPGIIEAENYDLGGQGIAFNDLSAANEGQAYRLDAVDIEASIGGGNNVGWIYEGEWLEYTVNITSGTYKIDARVAAIAAGKSFRLELDGAVIANFTVPNTGDWQAFQTVSVNNVSVSGGTKVLRVYATSTDFNLDKLIFSNAAVPSMMESATVSNSPNPFEQNTTITLDVKNAGYVSVKLFTKEGYLIQTLQEGYMNEGMQSIEFDASNLKNDIYYLKCETPTGVITHKILKAL